MRGLKGSKVLLDPLEWLVVLVDHWSNSLSLTWPWHGEVAVYY